MASTFSWKLILVSLVVLGTVTSQATARTMPDASMVERHESWMVKYGRTYKDETEKVMRFQIFKVH